MRVYRLQDVKKKRILKPAQLLYALAIFVSLALVVSGYAGVYTLQRENDALAEQLTALEEEIRQLQIAFPGEAAVRKQAQGIGMIRPDSRDVIIVHVRED